MENSVTFPSDPNVTQTEIRSGKHRKREFAACQSISAGGAVIFHFFHPTLAMKPLIFCAASCPFTQAFSAGRKAFANGNPQARNLPRDRCPQRRNRRPFQPCMRDNPYHLVFKTHAYIMRSAAIGRGGKGKRLTEICRRCRCGGAPHGDCHPSRCMRYG